MNPENTLTAVERAVDAGADAVEVDVRRCGTGELVVVHDETVDRVTDGTGRVADLSLSTLQSLDVLGTGAGVPSLSAVVATVPEDCLLNIELKETGLAETVRAVVADTDSDVLVSSFETTALSEVAAVSDLPRALLCQESALDRARQLDCRAIHPHESVCDREFVAAAHDAGLRVNAWTVRSQETARRLAEAGVDGLIADAPGYCGR